MIIALQSGKIASGPKGAQDLAQDIGARAFIQTDADAPVIDLAQVHAFVACGAQDHALHRIDAHGYGVEIVLWGDLEPQLFKGCRQPGRLAVGLLCDGFDAFRPMKHRIHRGHDRQQGLRGADVGRSFLAADMLFAGLQR